MSDLPAWLQQTLLVLLVLVPYLLWFAYCLWAVNWKRMWPTLAEGAWVPATLLVVLIALVWSQIRPSDIALFAIVNVGNFWWQLIAVSLLAALGLFAGWVQERYHWAPMEIAVEPPAHGHVDHAHGHDQPGGHSGAHEDPQRKHTAAHDHGRDRGGEA